MKKILLLLLVLFTYGCKEEACDFSDQLAAPKGYIFQKVDNIAGAKELAHLQMLTSQVGFLLNINDPSTCHLLKTIDGGETWNDVSDLGLAYPKKMFFLNELIGFVSFSHPTGDSVYYLKTIDGGLNWEEISQSQWNGSFHEFQKDENGNLYTYVGVLNTTILKSTDEGVTWTEIATSGSIDLLKVAFNKMYLVFGGDISVYDLDGNLLTSFSTNINTDNMVDFEIMDDNNFSAASLSTSMKTNDGGANWTELHKSATRIIGYSDVNHGLFLSQEDFCGENPNELFVASTTADGGDTWDTSETFQNLDLNNLESQKLGLLNYLLLANNEIYRIIRD